MKMVLAGLLLDDSSELAVAAVGRDFELTRKAPACFLAYVLSVPLHVPSLLCLPVQHELQLHCAQPPSAAQQRHPQTLSFPQSHPRQAFASAPGPVAVPRTESTLLAQDQTALVELQ